jgi:hypothetical protein
VGAVALKPEQQSDDWRTMNETAGRTTTHEGQIDPARVMFEHAEALQDATIRRSALPEYSEHMGTVFDAIVGSMATAQREHFAEEDVTAIAHAVLRALEMEEE